jgi:hypothetical protein
MDLTQKQKIIITSVALLTAFAVGRYSTPTKVKIVTQTVTVEKKVDTTQTNTDSNKHLTTVKTETDLPDGTKTIVTKTELTDDTKKKTDTKDVTSDTINTTVSKEVTRGSSPVTLSLLAGAQLTGFTPVYGGSISKEVLGPITLGAFYLSNTTAGLSVGLTF